MSESNLATSIPAEILNSATEGNQNAKKVIAAILATELTKSLAQNLPEELHMNYNNNDRIWDWYEKLNTKINASLLP
jgi:5,10-methylenetetrahydrofolate reductase